MITEAPLLAVDDLCAGYGSLRILHGVSLNVHRGEIVALIGPNGAGKSTLLSALSGLIPITGGRIVLEGTNLQGATTRRRMTLGLVHVLEGHRVIPSLTVEENLLLPVMGLAAGERRERIEQAFGAFPDLAAKRHQHASALSGGQQQMLVVGQGMVRRPKLLLLDEPSAGLAPVLIDRVLGVLSDLAKGGTAVLLVEQAVEKALRAAARVYALAHGEIVLATDAASARAPGVVEDAYLGRRTAPAPPTPYPTNLDRSLQ